MVQLSKITVSKFLLVIFFLAVASSKKQEATRNKCIASSNKCLTSSNKKLLETVCMGDSPKWSWRDRRSSMICHGWNDGDGA